jgi:hypothetical protein
MAGPQLFPDCHLSKTEGVAAQTEDDSGGILAKLFGFGVAADLDESDHQ